MLTATVIPSAQVKVRRSDPDVRRNDYATAFRFWLSHPDPRLKRILFLENSEADLGFLREIVDRENVHGKEVEFISTPKKEIPPGLHYGWGELKMLDEGLSRSRLAEETTHMIKATGRFTFPDIVRLLDRTPDGCQVMVECRIPTRAYRRGRRLIQALRSREMAYTTTQLAILSHRFYRERIFGRVEEMRPDDGTGMIESIFFNEVIKVEHEPGVSLRFPVNCDPVGVGARQDASYGTVSRRVIGMVRGALRGTGLWI